VLVLLSSDYSPRYKQDVLRCVSAPINAVVQFRYDQVHVTRALLGKLATMTLPAKAIVCSVATKGTGLLNLVPIRAVEVTTIRTHGSTISVLLKMGNVLYTESTSFTSEMASLSGDATPRKTTEEASPTGSYFFETNALPAQLQEGVTLALWEKMVTTLRSQHAYTDEPFFWTVIGVERNDGDARDVTSLRGWPESLGAGQDMRLLAYHLQPKGGPKPDSKLQLSAGRGLEIISPPSMSVDSRYDLKEWAFQTTSSSTRAIATWLRMRVADTWDLDLQVRIRPSYWRRIGRASVTGLLISAPSIAAILPQNLTTKQKVWLMIIAIVAGVLAGFAATFKIDRVD
jgi:hypothetical protein